MDFSGLLRPELLTLYFLAALGGTWAYEFVRDNGKRAIPAIALAFVLEGAALWGLSITKDLRPDPPPPALPDNR